MVVDGAAAQASPCQQKQRGSKKEAMGRLWECGWVEISTRPGEGEGGGGGWK